MKGKVYETVVRPAMFYGLEMVTLRKRQGPELEAAKTRMDRIRNEYNGGTAYLRCFGDKVREARLR